MSLRMCKGEIMESSDMIEISKIYVDKDGAGRLYVPKKILMSLGLKNKQQLMIRTEDSKMIIEEVQ